MRKFLIIASFFIGAPLMIFTSIFYLSYTLSSSDKQVLGSNHTVGTAYAALPPTDVAFEATIGQEESKTEIVRQFLERYNSELEPYTPELISASERYGLDHRLLPAIAMQESNLCRRIPEGSNNCWGWGIYGGKVTSFNNYPEAIETISKALGTKYRETHGLVTPVEVGKRYNPSNTNNWAENVTFFMNQMQ